MTSILNGSDVANSPGVRAAQSNVSKWTDQLADLSMQAAELAASNIPVVGTALDAKSFWSNWKAGSYGGMFVDAIGMVPGFGDGAKSAIRGTRLARAGQKALSQFTEAKKSLDVARKAAAARLYRKMQKMTPFEKYKEALRKCNSEACKRKAREQYKKDRYARLPQNGTWKGTPGDSMFVPNKDSELGKYMSQKYPDQQGINFKNGEPDFSPFAKEQVYIPNMGERKGGADVPTDFTQARQAMRDKNNGNWNPAVDERGLTWHHVGDGSTMQLVDSKIHNTATNGGGVAHSGGNSMTTDPEY